MSGSQCRAEYHGPAGDYRCDILIPTGARHRGDHGANDPVANHGRFRWDEAVAVYPHAERPLPPPFIDSRNLGSQVHTALGSARERQVGGDHYAKRKIQPWDIADEYNLNYFEGAILKYVLRHRDKNGVEDLRKARHTLDKLIEIEERREG